MSSLNMCGKGIVCQKPFPWLNKQSFVSVAEKEDPEFVGDTLASIVIIKAE